MVKRIKKKKGVKHYRPARRHPVRVSRRAAGPVMGKAHGSRRRIYESEETPEYAWNPDDKHADITLSNDDRDATNPGSTGYRSVRADLGRSTGKYYYEVLIDGGTAVSVCCADENCSLAALVGNDVTNCGYSYLAAGAYRHNNNYSPGHGAYTGDDVVQVAVDLDAHKIWFGVNNTWNDSGDPENGNNPAYSDIPSSREMFPACACSNTNNNQQVSLHSDQLAYTPPVGFSAWGG